MLPLVPHVRDHARPYAHTPSAGASLIFRFCDFSPSQVFAGLLCCQWHLFWTEGAHHCAARAVAQVPQCERGLSLGVKSYELFSVYV
jgi:hypothetical protein